MGQCSRNLEVQKEQTRGSTFLWWRGRGPNCSRAPQGVAVGGLSRSHTRTLSQGSQEVGGEGKRERRRGGKEGGREKRAQLA